MPKINDAIGVLGGSFDPPHAGHLKISKIILKKLNLKKIYWIVTKKNPFKKKPLFSLNQRMKKCLDITKRNKKIYVKYLDNKIKSSRAIKIVRYFKRKNKNNKIYLIIGSDNLINFHKWHQWQKISQKCYIVVFDRHGYKKKSLNSTTFKRLTKKNLEFIKFNKVNISSSQLRKI